MKTAISLIILSIAASLTGCCTTSCCVDDGCNRSVAKHKPHRQKRFCEHCAHGHHDDFDDEGYGDGGNFGIGMHEGYGPQFADASMGMSGGSSGGCCGGCQQGMPSGPMHPTPAAGPMPSSVPPYQSHPGELGPTLSPSGIEEMPPAGNGKTSFNASGPTYVSVEEFDRLPGVIVSGPRAQGSSASGTAASVPSGSSVPPASFGTPGSTQSVQQTNWVPAQR